MSDAHADFSDADADANADVDLNEALHLLDLNDEIIVKIARSVKVDGDIFMFLANFNKVNTRIHMLVKEERRMNATYCQEVGEIKYFVAGTRIPCGVQRALDLPAASTRDEVFAIFDTLHSAAPNGVYVSQPFHLKNNTLCQQHYDSWENVRNVGDKTSHDDREFFILVDIQFDADEYFQPTNVPILRNDVADLSRAPNVFRSVLGFDRLAMDYQEMQDSLGERCLEYTRVVLLHGANTIQDLWNSIAVAEGWNTVENSHDFDALAPDVSILDLFQYTRDSDLMLRPTILWPTLGYS
jgi:hypothetical protein